MIVKIKNPQGKITRLTDVETIKEGKNGIEILIKKEDEPNDEFHLESETKIALSLLAPCKEIVLVEDSMDLVENSKKTKTEKETE